MNEPHPDEKNPRKAIAAELRRIAEQVEAGDVLGFRVQWGNEPDFPNGGESIYSFTTLKAFSPKHVRKTLAGRKVRV